MKLQLVFPQAELQAFFPIKAEILFDILGVKSKFADWIKNRINQYRFIKNQDYIMKCVCVNYTKGRPRKEYFVTLDMAKELCMVENNEKGRQARRYFIDCEKRLRTLEQAQNQARFKALSDENTKLNSLNHHQKIGYKSQLIQQKEKYENKIKAMQYDLEKKNELGFKRKLSAKELLELRKILAKDYDTVCFPKWEYFLFAEDISVKNYKLEKENDFFIYKDIKKNFDRKLDYWKNYDECEAKWKKLLGRS